MVRPKALSSEGNVQTGTTELHTNHFIVFHLEYKQNNAIQMPAIQRSLLGDK